MYNDISKHYDKIFPFKNDTYLFLKLNLNFGKVLDLACGTGTYAYKLSEEGFDVVGYDLDFKMVKNAIEKSNDYSPSFEVKNMLDLDAANEYDSVYCIGNSLVHLNSLWDIRQLVEKVYNSMKNNGKFIIQIVNYDRILTKKIKSLPTIFNDNLSFRRDYVFIDNRIEFKTELNVDNQIIKNSVFLLPIKSSELIRILEEMGFKDIKTYGNFNQAKYDQVESFHFILSCKKIEDI